VYNRLIHPLRHVPGPFLATCFDLCYTYSFVRGMVPFDLLAMHEKYGPVVRLAPDRVSFVDYNDMRTIHATHAFPKHRTYRSFEWGQENMFSTNSAAFSKKRKRMLTPVFAPQSIARLEPLIFDVGIGATLRRMYAKCRRADSGTAVVDLYLLFFEMAFNTIGRLSFGESFDMVGDDDAANRASQNLIVGALKKLDYMLVAAALVPELVKNLWLQYVAPLRIVGASSFHDYAAQLVASRLTNLAAMQRDGADMCDKPVDILQLMIDTDDPDTGEKLGGRELVAEAMVTMFAGSDTAGNTLTFT
ncbi:cytochrome P450, partial [Ramicandelaber brevisporus]